MNGHYMMSPTHNQNDETEDMLFENINMEGIERKMELMVSFNETHQLDYSVLSKDDDYDEV